MSSQLKSGEGKRERNPNMQGSPLITDSPISSSFDSYSSEELAKIAARVVQEIGNESRLPDSDHPNIFSWDVDVLDGLDRHFQSLKAEDNNDDVNQNDAEEEDEEKEDDDDDFEFAVVWKEADSSSTSADEIFYNGQIRSVYPLFNTALLSSQEQEWSMEPVLTASKETMETATEATTTKTKKSVRSPLGKLFDEDRAEVTTSSSSSESDELDGVSPDTYCAWSPSKAAEESSAERCKKSNSAGYSKRWKLRDLVFRSHSDGKETLVFLTPSGKKSVRLLGGYKERKNNKKKAQEVKGSVPVKEHKHCVKNNYNNNEDKRRSYLPYRQDLVGLFSNNVHGLNKNLHPF